MNIYVEPGVVLTTVALVAGLILYTAIKSRHMERMKMLELGEPFNQNPKSYLEIKFGLLFMGVGIGILGAFILNQTYLPNSFVMFPSMIFLFGGLGLFISFFVVQRYKNEQ